jgi:hypothetical protein
MGTGVVQVESKALAAQTLAPSALALGATAAAGLAVAASAAWSVHYLLGPMRLLPASVRDLAAMYVLLTLAAGWGATRGILLLMGEAAGAARELPMRVGLCATWITPTLVFLLDRSEWAVLAIGALAISLLRLCGYVASFDEPERDPVDTPVAGAPDLFASARVSQAGPEFFGAICAALLVQESAAAIVAAKFLLAAGLAVLSAWVLWRCLQPLLASGAPDDPPKPLSHRAMSTRLSLVSLLTLMALLPHMVLGSADKASADKTPA